MKDISIKSIIIGFAMSSNDARNIRSAAHNCGMTEGLSRKAAADFFL
jgi:hypothetical protein